MSTVPTIPGAIRSYIMTNDLMTGDPDESSPERRARRAVENAQEKRVGRGVQAELPDLADDPEAREELAAYVDSVAGLITARIVSSNEVGIRVRDIRKASQDLRSAK